MPSTATTAPLDPSRAEISRAGCAYSWRRIPNRRRCSASSITPRTRWRYYAIDQRDLIRVSLEAEALAVLYFNPMMDDRTEVVHLRVADSGEFLDPWPRGFFNERDTDLFDE